MVRVATKITYEQYEINRQQVLRRAAEETAPYSYVSTLNDF